MGEPPADPEPPPPGERAVVPGRQPVGPVEFDPFSTVFFDDPYAMYRRLRDEAPVYYSEAYGFFALSRWDDVVRAHREWRTYSSGHGVDLATLKSDPDQIRGLASLIMMDPPDHDRLRSLVNRVFTPRAVLALESMVRQVVTQALEPLEGLERFDAVADFSGPFPVEIICRMLGVPRADRQQIRHWLDIALHRQPGRLEPTPEGIEAMVSAGAYFYQLAQDKRRHPGDDMISRLSQVEVERGDGSKTKLDDTEIAGFASLLGGAGAETVTKLVGNAVVLFARHPDQWRRVVQDPSLAVGAVEETLRFWPPSQYQGRYSVRPMTSNGKSIPAGFPVLLVTGAATRDERHFPDPDRFDLDRVPGLALGFGYGIHACLGAALARLESRVALEELARRWPAYRVEEENLTRVHMSNVAGFANVPVSSGPFTPRASAG